MNIAILHSALTTDNLNSSFTIIVTLITIAFSVSYLLHFLQIYTFLLNLPIDFLIVCTKCAS
jgi:hypothetical protein